MGRAGMGAQKNKKRKGGLPPRPPRNTVTLILDDSGKFLERYMQCQAHLYYWMLVNSEFRVRYGNRLVFTTPLHGTFYYVLRYKNRFIALVVIARTAWAIGFCTAKGFFQLESPDIEGQYMDSANTKVPRFDGNHKSISPDGTGSTIVNIHAIRRRFDVMCDYSPRHHHDPPELASSFGSMVVLFMEAKAWKVYLSHCNAIQGFTDETLGDWAKRTINNWSAGSRQALYPLDDIDFVPHDCGIAGLMYLDDLLDVFVYFHVDGCLSGMFQHDPMDPEPRKLTWDQIDEGIGDGDLFVPKEPVPRFNGPSTSAMLRKRVAPDTMESIEERKLKKPKGLLGGGLGGEPAAPEVFMHWTRAHNNKQRCIDLLAHLECLGLTVLDSKRPPTDWPLRHLVDPEAVKGGNSMKEQSNEKASGQADADTALRTSSRLKLEHLVDKAAMAKADSMEDESKEKASKKADADSAASTSSRSKLELSIRRNKKGQYHREISSLEAGQFVSDGVINFTFKKYAEELLRNGICDAIIVDLDASLLLSHGDSDGALKICGSCLVIFPIHSDLGGETHWSILVLDKWTKYGPRFIYYDSWDGTNLPFARDLADQLTPFVPPDTRFFEGNTPRQDNPFDSALYTIAIARSILRWCTNSTVSNEDDWSNAIWVEVNAKTTEKLRKSLHRGFTEKQQADGGNEPSITLNTVKPEAPIKSRNKGLCTTEIASLEPGQLICDWVINFVFNQYSQELWSNGVHDAIMVDANVSFLLSNGDTARALELCSNRLVIFPVNDNSDLGSEGGNHWSILVLDKWTELGPRFIHYDSYGQSNSPFANHLANVLHPFVPACTYFVEAETPQQENLFDCGLYVIAIARLICRWCTGAVLDDEEDWSHAMWGEVSAESTANLRTSLHLELQEHLQTHNSHT